MLQSQTEIKAEIDKIVAFLQQTFTEQGFDKAVIAVSGGIDSALALTLLARALPAEQIFPLLLPYGEQNMADAQTIIDFNHIPADKVQTFNIQALADQALATAGEENGTIDQLRLGNMMARLRMIFIFDQAKKKRALVIGTENKSEHLLAYYTRYGDEASDLEPLAHLYKTEVRALAKALDLPAVFLDKAPSAGLWAGQSDEAELGFSYELADRVLVARESGLSEAEILASNKFATDDQQAIKAIFQRLKAVEFKSRVPYRV